VASITREADGDRYFIPSITMGRNTAANVCSGDRRREAEHSEDIEELN
jgi:hypothetical protein